nr:putative integron gene cassette protein [uncultured bacterium]CAP48449.1 putative integron gene cassette protein [uncultured bacterium]
MEGGLMKATKETEGEIRAIFQRLTGAYERRNIEEFLACFASDDDVVLYGTGADEKRIGLEQIRAQVERDWAQTESISMTFTWVSISAAGSVAWAAIDGAFNFRANGQDETLPARVSFVLERRDDSWSIVHSHFSTPSQTQDEGQSF